VVLYRPSEESNPADPKVPDIQMFRVKRVWPEPETPWMTLTPAQWARHLLALRKWYAERIARRLAA
jgi:hypothetical protein